MEEKWGIMRINVWKALAVLDNIVPIICLMFIVACLVAAGYLMWIIHPWVFGGVLILITCRVVGAIAADIVRNG